MRPDISLDGPFLDSPLRVRQETPCGISECSWAFRKQDGRYFFVHDNGEQYAMIEISDDDLCNADLDIWSEQVKPWIGRLHRGVVA